jgi:AraC-like DNA-binding protein
MNEIGFLRDSIIDTISYEFISGLPKCHFEAHRTDWRMFPYTVIVCVFDSEYICEIEGEQTYSVKAGEVLIVPGGLRHRMHFDNPGFLNCVHIKYTMLNSIDILSFFEVPRILKDNETCNICDLVDAVSESAAKGTDSLKDTIHSKYLTLSLLDKILGKSVEKEDLTQLILSINTLYPVLDFIRNNLDKNITRRGLSEILSLSETRFHYVFKGIMNVAPMKYVKNERLNKAHILIATTNMTINEISISVGYADYSNFTRQFREYFGCSPSDIREKFRTSRTF